jgi:hypothetical protein
MKKTLLAACAVLALSSAAQAHQPQSKPVVCQGPVKIVLEVWEVTIIDLVQGI